MERQSFPNMSPHVSSPGPNRNSIPDWAFYFLGAAGVFVVFGIVVFILSASPSGNRATNNSQATQTAQALGNANAHSTATANAIRHPTPTAKPTTTAIHYPPITKADLQGLAAMGDASAIHEYFSQSVGLAGVCPIPRREVIVDPSITGQQLAEDLLAYFYKQQLDSPCGSLVLAFHTQSESDGAYTAGRINLDVSDSKGQTNIDPNGSNLKYSVTLDIGDVLSGQEYNVMY